MPRKQFLDCELFNASDAGARIEIADTGVLFDRFVLVLAGRAELRRACEVDLRELNHVGVKFVRASTTSEKYQPRRPSRRRKYRRDRTTRRTGARRTRLTVMNDVGRQANILMPPHTWHRLCRPASRCRHGCSGACRPTM